MREEGLKGWEGGREEYRNREEIVSDGELEYVH